MRSRAPQAREGPSASAPSWTRSRCAPQPRRALTSSSAPASSPEVIETALTLGLEPMPGVFTATEILTATRSRRARDEALPGLVRRAVLSACAARPLSDDRDHPDGWCPDRGSPGLPPGRCDGDRARSELVGRVAPQSDADLEWIAAQAARAPRPCATACCPRRRASDAALRARDASADRRSRRDRTERLPDAGLLRRARGGAEAAHQDAQAARARTPAGEGGSGRDHLPEARRSRGDGRCGLRRHPALVPARRRRESRAARRARGAGEDDRRRRLGGGRAGLSPVLARHGSRSTSWSSAIPGWGGPASRARRRPPSWPSSSTGSTGCGSPG